MKKIYFHLLLPLCAVLLAVFPAWGITFFVPGPNARAELAMRYFAEQEQPMVFYVTTAASFLCIDPCGGRREGAEYIPELYRAVCEQQKEISPPPNGVFEEAVYLGYFVVTPRLENTVPHLRWHPVPEFDAKEFWDPENLNRANDYSRMPTFFYGYAEALGRAGKSISEIRHLWWEYFVNNVFSRRDIYATRPGVPPDPAYRPRYTSVAPATCEEIRKVGPRSSALMPWRPPQKWMDNPLPGMFTFDHAQFNTSRKTGLPVHPEFYKDMEPVTKP